MHRTNIYLDDATVRSLKLLAAARGKSMSDLVRDAIDAMLAESANGVNWREEVLGILQRSHDRDTPDMSAEDIMAEVRAERVEQRRSTPR